MTSSTTTKAVYHWLSDGTKYKVTDPAGNGVIYAGDLTYTVTVSGGNTTYALESAEASADGTARFLKNGTAMTPYYTIRDHLGSLRTIVNASGTVVERNDYYPFGSRTTFGNTYATLAANRQKFSGKEDQTAVAGSTLPYLDFGARMYDAKLVRWNTYDPMAEKDYGINPYVYCAGDPVNMVDPEGKRVTIVNNKSHALSFLARIAATRLGEMRLTALISTQREYSLKRVFRIEKAGFRKSSCEVSYTNWTLLPRIDGGSKVPYALLGHEIEHAYRYYINDFNTATNPNLRNAERKAVGFENYIRKVYGKYPLRNRYSSLVGGKEGVFNPVDYKTEEHISNFVEIQHNKDNSAYGFSYDVSFNEGIGITHYIIIGIDQNRSLYFKKYTNKDDFDKEINQWEK